MTDNTFAIELMIEALISRNVDEDFARKYTEALLEMGKQSVTVSPILNLKYGIKLTDFGYNKIAVIKQIRAHTGWGLKEAKQACESGFTYFCESKTLAEIFKKDIEANGGIATLIHST